MSGVASCSNIGLFSILEKWWPEGEMPGSVPDEDVRSDRRTGSSSRRVVERRGDEVRGVVAGGVLAVDTASVFQALQLLQLHSPA